MAPTLVDSNVLLDVLLVDRRWFGWSSQALSACLDDGPILVNPVVYAEVSMGFDRIEDLDDLFEPGALVREPIPFEAAFLAGKAYLRYRSSRGSRTGVLPDFFIGAHAAVERLKLLTRDVKRFATYFPTVELISPT
jgi:predicted nucleic acid-binding protein